MSNSTITVRLSDQDIRLIDKNITDGRYTSRSDVIRTSIRQTLRDSQLADERLTLLAELAKSKRLTQGRIDKDLRAVRRKLYKEEYPDD
ncbi:MAG: ribbon-helix-helix domain-containing protein [Candidatus Dadabacteria bacterium]|nr:ribbon-helix-helix domain-containing protein [Candidatus Dadabacteria bacterium]